MSNPTADVTAINTDVDLASLRNLHSQGEEPESTKFPEVNSDKERNAYGQLNAGY
jgi:hypothetical protein